MYLPVLERLQRFRTAETCGHGNESLLDDFQNDHGVFSELAGSLHDSAVDTHFLAHNRETPVIDYFNIHSVHVQHAQSLEIRFQIHFFTNTTSIEINGA